MVSPSEGELAGLAYAFGALRVEVPGSVRSLNRHTRFRRYFIFAHMAVRTAYPPSGSAVTPSSRWNQGWF
jgi:hypothetical protein